MTRQNIVGMPGWVLTMEAPEGGRNQIQVSTHLLVKPAVRVCRHVYVCAARQFSMAIAPPFLFRMRTLKRIGARYSRSVGGDDLWSSSRFRGG